MMLSSSGNLCRLGISSIITQIRRSSSGSSPKMALEAMASQVEINGRREACCCALLDKNKKPRCLSSSTQSVIENGLRLSSPLSSFSSSPSRKRRLLM
uniref:Putative outer membrane adhesin-like protein n=1 Tax=Vibrio harveyi TaxID=669 RepID=E5G5P9_VIBHA|nr:putative outer membrane adhesin-like protein [Vibrio harveyi]